MNIFETSDEKRKDIIIDTSSINTLISKKDVLNHFFDVVNNKNYRAVIPYDAFREVSEKKDILMFLNTMYDKHHHLRIGVPPKEMIKLEIEQPILSNFYLKKDVDIFQEVIDGNSIVRHSNKQQKSAWKEVCKQVRNHFIKDFDTTPEDRNREVEKLLKTSLIEHKKSKDFFVFKILETRYQIQLPSKDISSNRNRYKYINLLYYLMYFNMCKSCLSGKSKSAPNRGDLFDMDIASFSAYSYGFISEDFGLITTLKEIKNHSKDLEFENNYNIYYRIENFLSMENN